MNTFTSRMAAYGILFAVLLVASGRGYDTMINIRPQVERPTLNTTDIQLIQALEPRLQMHVESLAGNIGSRTIYNPATLHTAADYIRGFWQEAGFDVQSQAYRIWKVESENLSVEIRGHSRPSEILIVGAHYDTVSVDVPGANDNASGVAALLEISRLFKSLRPAQTIRFVAFANEEPPQFLTPDMGSMHYAKRAKERGENIVGMISLETIGYYSEKKGSQHYPFPLSFFYPDTGNFLGVVGNMSSKPLVLDFTRHFMAVSDFPVECGALPGFIAGVNWSDHAAFWRHGYPAIMLTDTALFRYPYYHSTGDTPDKLDYASLARVSYGIFRTFEKLAE